MAITGASLQPIYERLNAVGRYHPVTANTFADWSVEAGDILTLDRETESYTSPVQSLKLTWRGTPEVTLNATGKQERESISKVSRRKYGRSGSGMWNDQGIYKDLYSEDGRLNSQLEFTASRLYVAFDEDITSTRTEFMSALEMTSSHLEAVFVAGIESTRTEFAGELEMTASGLEASFQAGIESTRTDFAGELAVTASALTAVFVAGIESTRADFAGELELTASGLEASFQAGIESTRTDFTGALEMTASHLETEFTDNINSLRSEFEITASHLQTEFTDDINSLRGELEITASHLQTEFTDDINSLRGELEITASGLYTEFTDEISSVRSEMVQTASSWDMRVSGVVDENGNVTAASITASINDSQSYVIISADHINLNGYVKATDLTANYINGLYTSSNQLDAYYIHSTGGVSAGDLTLLGSDSGGHETRTSVKNGIKDLQIVLEGNIYTLQYKKFNSSDWESVQQTFSRATTLTGAWGSGADADKFIVTASPQDQKYKYTPYVRLNGSTQYSQFSAELYDIVGGTTPSVHKSAYGYLIAGGTGSGSYVRVNTASDGSGTDVAQLNIGSLMQNNVTFRSNGVKTPDPGYIGFGDITIDVSSTPVTPSISHTWGNGGLLTVTTNPAPQSDLVRRLRQGSTSWNYTNNTATVTVVAEYGSQGQYTENTNFVVTVDARDIYTAGQDSVDVTVGEWITSDFAGPGSTDTATRASVTFGLSAGNGAVVSTQFANLMWRYPNVTGYEPHQFGTGAGYIDGSMSQFKTIVSRRYHLEQGTWSNNKVSVNVVGDVGSTVAATLEVNAGDIYNTGWNNARSYTVNNLPNTSIGSNIDGTYKTISVKYPGTNGSTTLTSKDYTLSLNSSFRPTGSTSNICAVELITGSTVVARIDANSFYRSGQNSVNVTAGAWTTKAVGETGRGSRTFSPSAGTGNTHTIYVGIGYREGDDAGNVKVYASGADSESGTVTRVKEIQLTMTAGSWDANNKATVTLASGTSTFSTLTVDASGLVSDATTAGKNAVTLNDPTWTTTPSASITGNSNTATVTTNGRPTQLSKTVPIYLTQGDWGTPSTNKKYVYANVTNSSDANRIARIEVNAGDLVTNAGYAGRAAVTLLNPAWTTSPSESITGNSNTATISTTGRTNANGTTANLSKTVPIYLTQGDWNTSTNKKYVYANVTNTSAANRIARLEVNGETIYSNGVTAGKNAVTINKGTWSGGKISFTKSEGTASTKSVQLTAAAATWSGNTASVVIWDGTAADAQHGSNTGYTVTVDAGDIYTTGFNDGIVAVRQSYNPNNRYVDMVYNGAWTGVMGYYIGDMLDAAAAGVTISSIGTTVGNMDDDTANTYTYTYNATPNPGWYMTLKAKATASNGKYGNANVSFRVQRFANALYGSGWDACRTDAHLWFNTETGDIYRPSEYGDNGEEVWCHVTDYGWTKGSSSPTVSYNSTGFAENTNGLPGGTKSQQNAIKTAIVDYRNSRGYNYIRIKVNSSYYVYYWVNNGNGWTS